MNDYTVNVPHGVTAHASAIAYQEAASERHAGFGIKGDLAGYDAIEHVIHDDGSLWRVSVNAGTVYAVLRRHAHAARYTFDGPVWEIATLPDGLSIKQHLSPQAIEFFSGLELRYRNEPASLRAVVDEIQEWAAEQRRVAGTS